MEFQGVPLPAVVLDRQRQPDDELPSKSSIDMSKVCPSIAPQSCFACQCQHSDLAIQSVCPLLQNMSTSCAMQASSPAKSSMQSSMTCTRKGIDETHSISFLTQNPAPMLNAR